MARGLTSILFSGWQSLARVVVVGVPMHLLLVLTLGLAGKHAPA